MANKPKWTLKKIGAKIRAFVGTDDRSLLLKQLPRGSRGAEIGVHLGEFSEKIVAKVCPRELHLIDPWVFEGGETYESALYGGKSGGQPEMDQRFESVQAKFAYLIDSGVIRLHRADAVSALSELASGSLDWVYIDGNHLFEFVAADLRAAYRVVRPGGWLAGDDYQTGNWWGDGVVRAVTEFVHEFGVTEKLFFGTQFLLRRPS